MVVWTEATSILQLESTAAHHTWWSEIVQVRLLWLRHGRVKRVSPAIYWYQILLLINCWCIIVVIVDTAKTRHEALTSMSSLLLTLLLRLYIDVNIEVLYLVDLYWLVSLNLVLSILFSWYVRIKTDYISFFQDLIERVLVVANLLLQIVISLRHSCDQIALIIKILMLHWAVVPRVSSWNYWNRFINFRLNKTSIRCSNG